MYKILDHYILLFKRKNFIFTCFIMVFFSTTAFAQRVTNIDKKGTERTTGNIVTESATAPTVPTPIQGDIWVDTTTNTTKFWDGNSWDSRSWSGGRVDWKERPRVSKAILRVRRGSNKRWRSLRLGPTPPLHSDAVSSLV